MQPILAMLSGWEPALGYTALLACLLMAVLGLLFRLAEQRFWKPGEPQPGREMRLAERSMEDILNNLRLLDPDELREEILKAGIKCGPITSTTRSIFEKKLARTLLEQQGVDLDALNSKGGKHATDHMPSQCSDDRDFGYSVGLNPPAEEEYKSLCVSATHSSLGNEARVSNQTLSNDPTVFYAVCPVFEDALIRNEKVHIYTDKKEALQVWKMLKGSRFKAFHSREEAEKFAKGLCEYFPSPGKSSLPSSPVKMSSSLLRDGAMSPEADSLNKEKANSFKSPRTQDLTAKLRKSVEKGDLTTFSDLIWSNPRYLIGAGDNPTVVQEGCRYNVMHVAAKENQACISQMLLDALESPDFMRLMYPDDDEVMLQKRIQYIVDLYLNTPDKMAFDTPLHFACKFGCAEVVNVLCSHPDIIKNPRNKYGQTPEEVICERSKNKCADLKIKIKEYLKGQFYVPLLRAEDNSSFPIIGVPWSPEQTDVTSQPRYCGSPKDSLLAVRAFAGPMSPSKAEDFRKTWKTPPREKAGFFHNVRKTDPERGEERVGRDLAHQLDVPWVEYWEFLGCFVDLSSQEGLGKLEEYLSKQEASERMQVDHDHEICNKYKTPSPGGRSKKSCNSVSVGAFLDDEEDMSLEEIKNRQNAALKNSLSVETFTAPECIMDTTPIPSSHCIDGSNLDYCSTLTKDHPVSQQDVQKGMLSPVSNLLAEFDKLSFSDQQDEESPCAVGCSAMQNLDRMTLHCTNMQTSNQHDTNIEPSTSLAWTDSAGSSHSDKAPSDIHARGNASSLGDNYLLPSYSSSGYPNQQLNINTPSKHQSNKPTFLLGKEPSKLDSDVLTAVEKVEVDAQKYPCISRWIKAVLSYSSTDRQSWPSPAVMSGRNKSPISSSPGGAGSFSTPGRNSPGKYMNTSDYSSPGRYSPAYASHIQLLRIRHFSDHAAL